MIFLIAAAALCMGGIVAYLAREKGRSPFVWAIYGTVAAPVALPHILIVNPLDDEDDDVWAEIRTAIQTQSVNDQRPIMARSGGGPAPDPQNAHRRAAPLRQPAAPSVTRPAAAPDIKPEPRYEPKDDLRHDPRHEPNHDMPADKRTPPHGHRAEPSFGPAAPAQPSARKAANDFILDSSDRIGAPHKQQRPPASEIDMRMRAPLSVDPDAERGERRPIAGKLFAFGAIAVAIGAGFFVLGPTLARLVPPELAFWSQPAVKEVKNTAPALTPFDALPNGPAGAQPNPSASTTPNATKEALPGGVSGGEARDVGTAKFGGPIKSDPKAPAYQGSGAAPTDLGAATRGMKPVEVPEETKTETKPETKSEPKSAPKAEPKAVAATPAPKVDPKPEPKAEAPKAAAVTPAPKVDAPKKAEAPKPAAPAPAPQAAAKPAPQEDFLSMVNKAITTGSTPKPAASATDSEQIEQVSAANDLVQSVQVKLRERGFDPGSIDGRTNQKTVQAIRDYQQSVGMTPDGLIDVTLMERLGVVGKRLQFPGSR